MSDRLPQIPAAQFVAKWQEQGPSYFVNLGYNQNAINARASKLRKAGVPLKQWSSGSRGLDIEALKAIAEKALSDSAESLDTPDTQDNQGDSDV